MNIIIPIFNQYEKIILMINGFRLELISVLCRLIKVSLSVNTPLSNKITMCSIIGYIGNETAAPIIVKGQTNGVF